MRRALFVDRDGVLDELVFYADTNEWEAPRRVEHIRRIEGAAEALERAREAGWLLFVITNQPSYAKGKCPKEDLEAVHAALMAALPVTQSYVCFHHPEGRVEATTCECRKPGTKFLRDAAREYDVELAQSWMIGDQDSDLRAGRAAGCRVALVETSQAHAKRGAVEPDLRVRSLAEFVDRVVGSGAQ